MKIKFNNHFYNKILIPIFGLMLFSLLVSTSALFIINGTTGNIILTPSFGMVGIGTINPINALTVIGSVTSLYPKDVAFLVRTGDVNRNIYILISIL